MKLTITTNQYRRPTFGKRINMRPLSPRQIEELPYREHFNINYAYRYFMHGPFKNIKEYRDSVKESSAGFKSRMFIELELIPKALNTLKFQIELARNILSKDALINNKFIRRDLYDIISASYNTELPETKELQEKAMAIYRERTDAKLKLLNFYAANEYLQNDKNIYNNISSLVDAVKNMEECNFVIDVLSDRDGGIYKAKKNFINKEPTFCSLLNRYLRYNIPIDIAKTILSNPELTRAISCMKLSNVVCVGDDNANNIRKLLDIYLKKYADHPLPDDFIEDIIMPHFPYIDGWQRTVKNANNQDPLALAIAKMNKMFMNQTY